MKLPIFALAGVLMLAGTFQANASSYVVDLTQEGSDVVATGSGSIDLTSMEPFITTDTTGYIIVNPAAMVFASFDGTSEDIYTGAIEGPTSLGPGIGIGVGNVPTSYNGDAVGVYQESYLYVPEGYVSGDPLSSSMTFAGQTALNMGITPGVYTWTWNGGADSFTVNAFSSVPEPSQYGFSIVLTLVALLAWRRVRLA